MVDYNCYLTQSIILQFYDSQQVIQIVFYINNIQGIYLLIVLSKHQIILTIIILCFLLVMKIMFTPIKIKIKTHEEMLNRQKEGNKCFP